MAVAALVLACLVGLLFIWLKGGEESALETYRSLASSSFTEELPPGIVLDRRGTRRLSGGEVLGSVSFLDVRKTRRTEGGIVIVTYQVSRSPKAAMSAYKAYWRGLREGNKVHRRGYRFFKTEIVRPHQCVVDVQEYCQAVVGNVTLEALSRIHMFNPREPSHVGAILAAALEHLDRVVD